VSRPQEAVSRPQPVARSEPARTAPSPTPSPAPEPQPAAQPGQEPAREQPFLKREGSQSGNNPRVQRAGESGGWLSDLLLRASKDDETENETGKITETSAKAGGADRVDEPSSRITTPGNGRNAGSTALDSLNAISVDIARMVDHAAVAAAWERFNRGETGVFTREIYTRQGQPTFEEIQRKYAREPEFRQTVDRYVEEFERLLREVARDDRDRLLTRSYLVSETGKVYTMLAHASGRLG